MARWSVLGALMILLLVACAQSAAQPTGPSSPVAALPSASGTTQATAAATDSAVPTGTTPPATTATGTLPPLGMPTVLVTPSPLKSDQQTDQPASAATPKPATTGTPKPATPSPGAATPSPSPKPTPTKTPTSAPTPTKSPSPAPTKTPTSAPTPTKSPSPAPTATPKWDINITGDGSNSPPNYQAFVGQKVWWWNSDNRGHNVRSTETSPSPGLNSPNIDSGGFFSHTFNDAGEYRYWCTIHKSMNGTVTVT